MAHGAGFPVRWRALFFTLFGVLGFHTAANLLNDVFDYRRGLDRRVSPHSGAIVRGWITEILGLRVALISLGAGIACGLVLFVDAGWVVFLLGLLGTVCAAGYTTPRFCLKYAGLGDLAIFMAFGILPVFGSWWVQTRSYSWMPVLWSLPIAFLAVGILHGNNWRDLESDRKKGCRTMAVLLGPEGSRRYYRFLVLSPFALVVFYVGLGQIFSLNRPASPSALTVFLAFPMALRLARTSANGGKGEFAVLDAKTARLHLLFGILCLSFFLLPPIFHP